MIDNSRSVIRNTIGYGDNISKNLYNRSILEERLSNLKASIDLYIANGIGSNFIASWMNEVIKIERELKYGR